MSEHAIIPPSSAARRAQCPASRIMEASHPDTAHSEAAAEGTAAHELAAILVRDYCLGPAPLDLAGVSARVGDRATNGVEWTQEMYDSARIYADHVRDVMQATGCLAPHIEERVHCPDIHPESWGTPDCWLYDRQNGVLHVWDYKHGHLVVEAIENEQLIEYASGILDELGINGLQDQHVRVQLHVVQPRAYHRLGPVRTWETLASDLRPYFNWLASVEAESLSENARCITGPQCRYCSARHACETLQQAGMASIAYAGEPVSAQLEGEALGLELRLLRDAAETIKARITGLETQAEAMIQQGQTVPGWSLEPGRARSRWDVPADEVFIMGDMMGVDLRKPPEPITPNQAIKKGIDREVITGYCTRPAGKMQLVESTKTTAAAVFAKRR